MNTTEIDKLNKQIQKLQDKLKMKTVSLSDKQAARDEIKELQKKIGVLEREDNIKIVPVLGADIIANEKAIEHHSMYDNKFIL